MQDPDNDQRSLKNVKLTRRFHWPYFGGWLRLTIGLVVFVEVSTLYMLSSLDPANLPFAPGTLVAGSALMTVAGVSALVALGRFSAHRIAGVHLRTEKVLRQLAEGKQDVQLRFRSEDELEDVEAAFEAMVWHLQSSEPPVSATEEQPEDEEAAANNRRSWRNIQMTSRYHHKYMAIWMLISLGLLTAAYGALLLLFYVLHYQGHGPDPTVLTLVVTPFVIAMAGLVMWRGYLTAHRLAGVHLRLANVFHSIARGERDVELRFRSYDRLENLEAAFAQMMEWVNTRDRQLA